jgi:hypothetical protein
MLGDPRQAAPIDMPASVGERPLFAHCGQITCSRRRGSHRLARLAAKFGRRSAFATSRTVSPTIAFGGPRRGQRRASRRVELPACRTSSSHGRRARRRGWSSCDSSRKREGCRYGDPLSDCPTPNLAETGSPSCSARHFITERKRRQARSATVAGREQRAS